MASEMRGGETQGWNDMQHTITQACLSCPHASMKCLTGPLMQPEYMGQRTYNIMVPTKEAGKEPTEHPEGQPIVASAKTLYSKTNTKLTRQRLGPDVQLITTELMNTITTYTPTHHS